MSLYDIYAFVSSPIIMIVMTFATFLYIGDIHQFFKYLKTKEEPNLFIDFIFEKLSFPIRKFLVILLSIIFSMISLFLNDYFLISLGCEDIRVMPDGTYCYYVLATNEKDKTYTLPANINKSGIHYGVENIYFKNGGYLYFDYYDYFEYEDSGYQIDQNEKEWKIKLTNRKTYHPKVEEERKYDISNLLFLFFITLIFVFATFLHTLRYFKCRKSTLKSSNIPPP